MSEDVLCTAVTAPVFAPMTPASKRGPAVPFDMGPPLAEILKNCKAETGLEPPQPPVFKKIAKMPIYKSKPSMSKLVLKKRVA